MSHRRTLTRREWTELGTDVKRARELLNGIAGRVGDLATNGEARKWSRLASEIDGLKVPLDLLVGRQHPAWEEGSHVFYGQRTPESIQADPASCRPTLAAEAEARRGCRSGLLKLRVRRTDGGGGEPLQIVATAWQADGSLGIKVGDDPAYHPASCFYLADRWPVTCCRPSKLAGRS